MELKNIASAFVKAQKSFAPALKTNTNPHFRSRYVGLDGCIEAVIDALNTNGIALLQPTHPDESGVTVETLFVHESGEVLSGGKLHVPAAKNDPQGYGSALTYARRYSLMAACGIAPEDDDGNAASKGPDVAAIIQGISRAGTLEILRSNYEAAIQMLPAEHHAAVKKATNARKAQLQDKAEEKLDRELNAVVNESKYQ